MNRSKFSWGEVIGIFATLAFGFICYMSMYIKTLGNFETSLTIAFAISLVLWFLTFLLVRMKKASRNFKRWCIGQGIVLLMFVITAFIALPIFSHIFAVSRHKTEILQKTNANISQVKNMFDAYRLYSENRIKNYTDNLETAIRGKNANLAEYARWGFDASNGIPDEERKASLASELQTGLFDLGYTELNASAREWLSDAKYHCTGWNPLPIMDIIYSIEKQENEWKQQLSAFSVKAKMQGENSKPFDYTISFEDLTSLFKTVSFPSATAILTALAACLLMLIPWMVTEKHPRNNVPCLKLFSGDKRDEAEGRL